MLSPRRRFGKDFVETPGPVGATPAQDKIREAFAAQGNCVW